MVVVLIAVVFIVLPAALVAGYALGVVTGYKARQRQRQQITALTARLNRPVLRPPITVSYAPGVPLLVLQHRPEINRLREQVVEHWREHSAPDDDLIH
jgi:hypothetical protein